MLARKRPIPSKVWQESTSPGELGALALGERGQNGALDALDAQVALRKHLEVPSHAQLDRCTAVQMDVARPPLDPDAKHLLEAGPILGSDLRQGLEARDLILEALPAGVQA